MTNKKILALMFTATLMLAGCGSDDDDPIPSGKSNNNKNVVKAGVPAEVTRLEFPRLREIGNNVVVVHKTSDSYSDGVNYSVEWDIEKKSQRWSCYQMMRGYQVTGVKRYKNDANQYPFDEDLEKLVPNAYFSQDYYWSDRAFNHGHILMEIYNLYCNSKKDCPYQSNDNQNIEDFPRNDLLLYCIPPPSDSMTSVVILNLYPTL